MTGLVPVSFRKGREHKPRLSTPYVPGRRHARFWTEAEKQVLRDHYSKNGARACREYLPNRELHTIYQMAKKLGLKGRHMPVDRRSRMKPEAVARVDAQIRAAWPELKGRGAVSALADRLDVARHWLTKRAIELGLTMPHKKEPDWTPAELELLARVPLHEGAIELASRTFRDHGFNRSPSSLRIKAKRLGISRRYSATFSATPIAKILGVDSKTVTTWIIKGWLKAEKRPTNRLPQQGGDPWSVTRADLRQWIIDNLERIDFRKVDKFQLVDVLTRTEASA